MNILVCILAVALFAYLVWKKRLYRKWMELTLCIILCGFMPLAVAFIYFMAPEVDYSMLMFMVYINLCACTCNGRYLHGRMGAEQWHRIEKVEQNIAVMVLL